MKSLLPLLLLVSLGFFGIATGRSVQLVGSDGSGNLFVTNQGAKRLMEIEGTISVVGVVGPFHSGKSFLMNQLMDLPSEGFRIGTTVVPETKGLWISDTKSKGSTSIIFVDTEGFFANNVSEAHDAKIFAVTTLLSSHLLYNTVKMIDQSAIEHLQVLARRTQLFSVRAEANHQSQNNHKFPEFRFPALHWLVQDFFQDLEGKTCTQWLHELLKGGARDEGFAKMPGNSLDLIFPTTECHTFFLPASKKEQLRHLDTLKESDYNGEYLKEMEAYKVILQNQVYRKGGKFKDGTSVLSLLKALVFFSNSGSFPSVPSIWEGFLEVQVVHSVNEALAKLKNTVNELLTSTDPSPLKPEADHPVPFTDQERRLLKSITSMDNAHKLLSEEEKSAYQYVKKMLFGIDSVTEKAEDKLRLTIASILDLYQTKFVNHINDAIEIVNKKVKALDNKPDPKLAVPYKELRDSQLKRLKKMETQFFDFLSFNDPLVKSAWEKFNEDVKGIHARETLLNMANVKLYFEDLVSKCELSFDRNCSKINHRMPLEESSLKDELDASISDVKKMFQDKSAAFKDDPPMEKGQMEFNKMIEKIVKSVQLRNIEETKKAYSESLNRARRRISGLGKTFYFSWSFKAAAKKIILEELGNKIKSSNLVNGVVNNFIESDLAGELEDVGLYYLSALCTRIFEMISSGTKIVGTIAGIVTTAWGWMKWKPTNRLERIKVH